MEENITAKDYLIQEHGFTPADFDYIKKYGISIEKIARELKMFESGIENILLERPAKIGDGIRFFSENEFQELASFFENHKKHYTLGKFVPASGAASRMFKFLIEFLNEFRLGEETINAYINRQHANKMAVFLVGMEKFPFYEMVLEKARSLYTAYDDLPLEEKVYYFVNAMLSLEGFNFSNKPKGVLPFHKSGESINSPIEKHLEESTVYVNADGKSKVHFTVSKEHLDDFEAIVNRNAKTVVVSYSFQHLSTDTIAVDMNNTPFRLDGGNLFFRPGGHGALIENLNQLQEDIVFIRNIDNVAYNHFDEIVFYKKALGGLLFQLQKEVFAFLDELEAKQDVALEKIISFANRKLNIVLPKDFGKYSPENQKEELFNLLNRPIRICGMVKNEGEPGGGPFWIHEDNGTHSLQIVESSQIDLHVENQQKIFEESTHFNPVDLICGIKNYKGEKFDLTQFVNPNAGFIVEKTKNGKDIKAYELPGLWNGAMANWITVFVEVPLITFNPVKTVNDLLKPAHQPE